MPATKIIQQNKAHILYDACVISTPSEDLFNPQWLVQQTKQKIEIKPVAHESNDAMGLQPMSMGRGAAWFVDYDKQQWVLRHYRRGGMLARWNKQLYLGVSLEATRAWQEWRLLNSLYALDLPVPQPVAAWVTWPYGRWSGLYKAAILINRIPHAMTLAEKCQRQNVSVEIWRSVGQCIRMFHNHNVYHADLNANNILFDQNDKVYLIDFDKGCIKSNGMWKAENLNRLHRSLLKLQGMYAGFGFLEKDWGVLLDVYKG
jgi:3-deoxy-D-manno-octulosonic acid kinase